MKTMAVGEFKSRFSAVLDEIKAGHPVAVGYGKAHRRIAVLLPYAEFKKRSSRKLGILAGKGTCRITGDFAVTDEELLRS